MPTLPYTQLRQVRLSLRRILKDTAERHSTFLDTVLANIHGHVTQHMITYIRDLESSRHKGFPYPIDFPGQWQKPGSTTRAYMQSWYRHISAECRAYQTVYRQAKLIHDKIDRAAIKHHLTHLLLYRPHLPYGICREVNSIVALHDTPKYVLWCSFVLRKFYAMHHILYTDGYLGPIQEWTPIRVSFTQYIIRNLDSPKLTFED